MVKHHLKINTEKQSYYEMITSIAISSFKRSENLRIYKSNWRDLRNLNPICYSTVVMETIYMCIHLTPFCCRPL